jgi:hypothetical protein
MRCLDIIKRIFKDLGLAALCAERMNTLWYNLLYISLASKTKIRGFSPQANYTDQAIAACRQN